MCGSLSRSGSIALALILFDGGLRTRFMTFRSVLAPAGTLATVGVLVTSALVAPAAVYAFDLNSVEGLLMGAAVASTDAAAVFFLMHARGLRVRPRVAATIEVESGTNDPFAIFLTLVLVEILLNGQKPAIDIALVLLREATLGTVIGIVGGVAIVALLNRVELPQGLHAPFVATGAIVTFGLCQSIHASGFLAVYLAGLIVGNRATRARDPIIAFLDASTWLAQIAMFVLFGLLAWPQRLPRPAFAGHRRGADADAGGAPGRRFPLALAVPVFGAGEIVHFLGGPARRGRLLSCLDAAARGPQERADLFRCRVHRGAGVAPGPRLDYRTGSTLAARRQEAARGIPAAHRARSARPADPGTGWLSGDAGQPVSAGRDIASLGEARIGGARRKGDDAGGGARRARRRPRLSIGAAGKGDSVDRFFADLPPPSSPDPQLLGDFFLGGDATLGALSDIYGVTVEPDRQNITVSALFSRRFNRAPQPGDSVRLGDVALVVHRVKDGKAVTVGLQLAEEETKPRWQRAIERMKRALG